VYDSRLDKAARLKALLPGAPPGGIHELPLELYLFDDAQLSVVYAPLDAINTEAHIVLIGLTPSWRQAQAAYAAHAELSGRLPEDAVGFEVKRRTAFAGSMRKNLVAMLDELHIGRYLGVESTAALFAERADALHSTSALRYPVFKAGKNYSGQHPKPVAHPFLRAMLERLCAPELARVPNALIVPLGKATEEGLEHLTSLGLLEQRRWLRGFPHPSSANAHRKAEFSRAKEELEWQVETWFSRGSLPPPRFGNEWQGQSQSNGQGQNEGHGRLAAGL
jgi:hypothetical protein